MVLTRDGQGLTAILLHCGCEPVRQTLRVSNYCGNASDGQLWTFQVSADRMQALSKEVRTRLDGHYGGLSSEHGHLLCLRSATPLHVTCFREAWPSTRKAPT